MKNKIYLIALILVMLLSACNNSEAPLVEKVPEKGGEIYLGVSEAKIDPFGYVGSENPNNNLDSLVYRGLMKYDENLKLNYSLAEEIRISEEINEIEIILKDNIKWEDGTSITVEDVKFTYEIYSDSNYNGYWKLFTFNITDSDLYRTKENEHISGIAVVFEERSIIIKYADLTAKDLEFLTAPIISQQQFIEDSSINKVKEISLRGELLASGPFKVEKHDDSNVILTRNDSYEEDVFLDKIIISEDIEKSEYDVMLSTPVDTQNEIYSTRKILSIDGQAYEYLGMNLNSPKLDDLLIRKAISSVINYTDIANNIFKGYVDKPLSIIHPKSWAYVANEEYYDLEKAKIMLEEEGLILQLAYEDTLLYQLLAEQIAKDLVDCGVKIELIPIRKDQYIPTLFSKGDFDLFLASWTYEYDPVYENKKWLAKNDVLENGYNVSHVNDEASDNLLIQGSSVTSESIRQQYYIDWQNHFMGQYYIIPLASQRTIFMYTPELHVNITNSLVPYVDIQNWWKEKVDENSK